ncbi:MAG: hypothetical protein MI725_16420, partial [Pirellulales bacterium]|nr:hypothetical protein [Pirellulales bacterium]
NYPQAVYEIREGWEANPNSETAPAEKEDRIVRHPQPRIGPRGERSILISTASIGRRGERSILVWNGGRL